ncbi:MAG TPA: hypothetical protein VGJ09_15410 [Bryobacteraceae bacterium]|jgi:hypothetical protein
MKKNLLKSAVLAASLVTALSSASAETLHARIPFAFSAAGTSMPAGTYAITTMPHSPQVLLFENEESKVQNIIFARIADLKPGKPAAPLMFTSSSGEHQQLTNIATDDWAYELDTRPMPKPLKGVALTLTPAGQ